MAEDFVQVAPDSTGAKVRTRSRVIGANTVEEQYVIVQPEAVAVNRVWLSTLRIPNRVQAAPTAPAVANQPLFTIWNGIAGGGNSVSIRRLSVEIDSVLVHAAASPTIRLYRTTAAGANGTVITPVQQYSPDAAFNSLVAVRADHGTDNVSAGTALTAGTVTNTQPMWAQTVPRAHTVVGFQSVNEYNLLPNDGTLMAQDPLILRPSEGLALRLETTVALVVSTWTFQVKAVLAEFTYP